MWNPNIKNRTSAWLLWLQIGFGRLRLPNRGDLSGSAGWRRCNGEGKINLMQKQEGGWDVFGASALLHLDEVYFILLGKLAGKHEYVCNVHLSKMSPFWLKWNCDHRDQKKTVPHAFYLSSLFEPCLDSHPFSSQRLPPRKAAGFQPMRRRMQMPCNGLRLLLVLPRRRRSILPTLVPSL